MGHQGGDLLRRQPVAGPSRGVAGHQAQQVVQQLLLAGTVPGGQVLGHRLEDRLRRPLARQGGVAGQQHRAAAELIHPQLQGATGLVGGPGPEGDLNDAAEGGQGLAGGSRGANAGQVRGAGELVVSWLAKARGRSAAEMPPPSSTTRRRSIPPWATSTATRAQPASAALSNSSLTALACRSTTSPAAICSGWMWVNGRPGSVRQIVADLDVRLHTAFYRLAGLNPGWSGRLHPGDTGKAGSPRTSVLFPLAPSAGGPCPGHA